MPPGGIYMELRPITGRQRFESSPGGPVTLACGEWKCLGCLPRLQRGYQEGSNPSFSTNKKPAEAGLMGLVWLI